MELREVSERLAGVVEGLGGSVVRVEGRRRRPPASGVVWSDDIVVTAHHTVDWDEDIVLGLPGGAQATGTLVGRDSTTDLAAIRVASGGLRAPAWDDGATLKVGHLVLAIARPGRSVRAGLGIVSVSGESWTTPAGGRLERYLQSDISLHPGFSGSALVDAEGRCVGLNTAGLLRGLSTAIPTTAVRRIVQSLLAHGRVRRGFLGVGTYPVRLPAELGESLSQKVALLVLSVEPDSPAARAGLVLGDVLVSCDGQKISQAQDLLPILEEEHIGHPLSFKILRGGDLRDVTVTVGDRTRS